jgi:hypothetical protein
MKKTAMLVLGAIWMTLAVAAEGPAAQLGLPAVISAGRAKLHGLS